MLATPSPNARDTRETREKRYAVIKYDACFHEKVEDYDDVEKSKKRQRPKLKMVFAERVEEGTEHNT